MTIVGLASDRQTLVTLVGLKTQSYNYSDSYKIRKTKLSFDSSGNSAEGTQICTSAVSNSAGCSASIESVVNTKKQKNKKCAGKEESVY